MAIDKAKTQKAAEKFIASGKVPQAIEEYLKILKENPKDWNLMIQIGDLYLKINKNPESIGMFQKVADHYYSDGFFLKAIAIYKRINKLDPSLIDICIKLSDLYLKQGLTMDAKSQLQAVASYYVSKNQTKDAITTFRKLIEIEPDNLKTRNELAKAYKHEGMIPEAVKEYLEISDELTRKNLLKESLAVLETAYKLDPRNTAILRKILSIYHEQNEVAKGITLLEESLRNDPSNAEALALLAESYAGRKQYSKAYETIDRALLNTTNKEPLWSLKGELYIKEGDIEKAFGQYSLVVERNVQRRETEKAIALMQGLQKVDPSFPPVLQKLVDLFTMAHQETNMLSAYSSLIDAYISKAMYMDASKCLEKLIQIEPDNAQHHEKLGFVKSFLEKPKVEVKEPVREEYAVEEEVAGGEISSGDFDLGITMETEPGLPVFEARPAPATPQAAPAKPKPAMAPAPAVAEVSEEEKDFVSEHLIETEVFTKYGLIDKAIEQLQIIVAKYPNSVIAHQKLKEIYQEKGERDKAVEECVTMSNILRKQGDSDQADDVLSEARQINPNHPALVLAYKEIPAAAGTTDVLGEIEKLAQSIKTKPAAAKPAAPRPPAPAPPPSAEEIEIEIEEPAGEPAGAGLEDSAFEEIDFYIQQGLSSEAKKMLHSMRKEHPSDPGVLSRLANLGEKVAPAGPKPAPAPVEEEVEAPVEEEISFSLDEELAVPEIQMATQEEAPDSVEETWDLEKIQVTEEETPVEEAVPAAEENFDLDLPVEIPEPTEEESLAELDLGMPETEEVEEEPLLEVPSLEEMQPEPAVEEEEPAEVPLELELPEEPLALELPEEEVVEPQPEEAVPIELEAPQSEEAPSFGEIGDDLESTDFGELETGAEPAVEEPAVVEEKPVQVADEEESLSDVLDAAFEGTKEESPESTPVKASQELFQEEEDFFDLAAELEEGFLNVQSAVQEDRPADGQNYSLEEILSDFKKGVEKQLDAEDYDTRYNLGIAYKEMGLIDEAIGEFQIAAKDTKRFLECCSMLGLCFVEKGMPKLAIKWYQRGLDIPGHVEDEYQGLRFELAQAYAVAGEGDKALEIFQEVYEMNANYRNVSKKIKELQDQLKKK